MLRPNFVKIDGCVVNINEILFIEPQDEDTGTKIMFKNEGCIYVDITVEEIYDILMGCVDTN